jgi:hypothetical protein
MDQQLRTNVGHPAPDSSNAQRKRTRATWHILSLQTRVDANFAKKEAKFIARLTEGTLWNDLPFLVTDMTDLWINNCGPMSGRRGQGRPGTFCPCRRGLTLTLPRKRQSSGAGCPTLVTRPVKGNYGIDIARLTEGTLWNDLPFLVTDMTDSG